MLLKGPEIEIGQFGLTVDLHGDRKRTELRVGWWGYEGTSYVLPEISMPPGANVLPVRVDLSHFVECPVFTVQWNRPKPYAGICCSNAKECARWSPTFNAGTGSSPGPT